MPAVAIARDHLHAFMRALEDAGVAVSPPKKADFLVAIVASPPDDVDALYWRARVTLVTASEAFDAFDAVFDAYFRGGRQGVEEPAGAPPDEGGETAAPRGGDDDGTLDPLESREGSGLHASPLDLTHVRSFAPTTPAGRDELRELAGALETVLPQIAARRSARARRGPRLDVRRVLALANRSGGEIVRFAWLRRPPRPRRVLLLIDVSGSQRAHSPDLLRFAHEAVRATDRAEAFTFGTRLTRVTAELDTPDVDDALASLSACVLDADGGTRIGVALQQFLANGRHLALARGALVIVLSDGLERGDPSAMAEATRRLGRLAHRLVWWSPLACDPAYRPATRGMHAILGEIDTLAGARDLPSLLREVRRLPETFARPRRTASRAWSTS
ncbi:MAG TPA: VWA domain-containing protein [Solirubrobacteraceae bacterium]|nr:VWA domain-containing protein [Solirubrobacteraceae bacterium]